jgi:sensor c-di-GMP phosphodiesterase-like protein
VQKAGYTRFRDSGFILLISFAAAYAIDKYLNKNDTPEETLRRAIVKGEIVPFYQPIVNGREGRYAVLKCWPDGNIQKPDILSASFIPVAEKSGLIVPLTQSLMRQVAANMNAIASKLPSGFHVGINFNASHITSPHC